MASTVPFDNLTQLVLSAQEIKAMNPAWPDKMIEDYLNILRDLLMLTQAINNNAAGSDELESLVGGITSDLGQLQSRVYNLQQQALECCQYGSLNGTELAQLSSTQYDIAERLEQVEQLINEPFPFPYINPRFSLKVFTFSTTAQVPTALDTPFTISWGPAANSVEVSVSAAGLITINKRGTYRFVAYVLIQRTSNPGTTLSFIQLYKNGAAAGNPIGVRIPIPNISLPFQLDTTDFAEAGDTYRVDFYNDSGGTNNDARLLSYTSVLYTASPSASLRILRLENDLTQ
jgi:hypothetical protein